MGIDRAHKKSGKAVRSQGGAANTGNPEKGKFAALPARKAAPPHVEKITDTTPDSSYPCLCPQPQSPCPPGWSVGPQNGATFLITIVNVAAGSNSLYRVPRGAKPNGS